MLSFWIDRINAEYRAANNLNKDIDLIKFVDKDEAYSGGRMCRQEIEEPDRDNAENYWYNFYSNPKKGDSAVVIEPLVDASAYASINPSTCEAAADATGKMNDMLACFTAKHIAQGELVQNDDGSVSPAGGKVYPALVPEALAKSFHPTPLGFKKTALEL